MNSYRGFTLIETLIYLALFGVIIGGVTAAVYSIIEVGGRNQTRIELSEEGNFLLGKLNWALSGSSSISVASSSPKLVINKFDFADNPLVFDISGGHLRLKQGSNPALNLNRDELPVSNLVFQDVPASGGRPEGLRTEFTLTGKTPQGISISQSFQTTKYLQP